MIARAAIMRKGRSLKFARYELPLCITRSAVEGQDANALTKNAR